MPQIDLKKIKAHKGPIISFRGDFAWLSNMWECPILFNGFTYPSAENAFQSVKSFDLTWVGRCTRLTPWFAKRHGKYISLRPDWEEVKLGVMLTVIRAKFQNSELREALLATGDNKLIEGNTWRDTFWGQCPIGNGENHLGKILMQVRDELRRC